MFDLKAFAGDRYRVALDPSAEDDPRSERLWLYRIPCRYGFISVHGEDTLAASTDRRGLIRRLVALEGVRVHQRGDREARVLFPPGRLDSVAGLLRARRRVRLSPEERERRRAQILRARESLRKPPLPAAP
jgi:hypothetical protein